MGNCLCPTQPATEPEEPTLLTPAVSPVYEDKGFESRLNEGIKVLVIVSSGVAIEATLSYDEKEKALKLAHEANVRLAHLAGLSRPLHTPNELKRIGTEADLDDHCVGLLMKSKMCITLRLSSSTEVSDLVSFMSMRVQ
ncbi:MAG: uncharacterized protein KVP18_005212 [Porospora cf. gigantea A]|uniref:uncharacterized protein n=1 Tax=Porospora cf. gigantea A TaxID=2853593 RepID=UPI00355AA66F|nr:MAG: hypothetical protein KVP18_005212 [Porospora cf. gigantea A]